VARRLEPSRHCADRAARRRRRRPLAAAVPLARDRLENSRKEQTYNTPAVATLFLLADQIEWLLDGGGLEFGVSRSRASSQHLYGWAEASELATPFVADPAKRSLVVGTIDFAEQVDAAALAGSLRANGIVDVEALSQAGP
jgi:phosphoserine aminotransferase